MTLEDSTTHDPAYIDSSTRSHLLGGHSSGSDRVTVALPLQN